MHSSFYRSSSISETLDMVERGFARLGISSRGTIRMPAIAPHDRRDLAPYCDVTPELVERMKALTLAGLTQKEIASALGCSQSAVSKNLTASGIRIRQFRKRAVA